MWRGQTIEQDAWNRVKEYDRQHGVTETWSQVADASQALLDADRRQRDGGARREPLAPISPACGASRSAPRWRARSPRAGRSRRRRCARTRRRSSASSASPSSPGCRSSGARTDVRSARRAPCASPRRRRRRTPNSSGNMPPPSSPRSIRPLGDPIRPRLAARRNTRGRRASCAAPTGARPRRPTAAGRRASGTGLPRPARPGRARRTCGRWRSGSRRRPSRS